MRGVANINRCGITEYRIAEYTNVIVTWEAPPIVPAFFNQNQKLFGKKYVKVQVWLRFFSLNKSQSQIPLKVTAKTFPQKVIKFEYVKFKFISIV